MEPDATASSLEKALAGIFKSSKAERHVPIEILAVRGVLQPQGRAGYFGEFTLIMSASTPASTSTIGVIRQSGGEDRTV